MVGWGEELLVGVNKFFGAYFVLNRCTNYFVVVWSVCIGTYTYIRCSPNYLSIHIHSYFYLLYSILISIFLFIYPSLYLTIYMSIYPLNISIYQPICLRNKKKGDSKQRMINTILVNLFNRSYAKIEHNRLCYWRL